MAEINLASISSEEQKKRILAIRTPYVSAIVRNLKQFAKLNPRGERPFFSRNSTLNPQLSCDEKVAYFATKAIARLTPALNSVNNVYFSIAKLLNSDLFYRVNNSLFSSDNFYVWSVEDDKLGRTYESFIALKYFDEFTTYYDGTDGLCELRYPYPVMIGVGVYARPIRYVPKPEGCSIELVGIVISPYSDMVHPHTTIADLPMLISKSKDGITDFFGEKFLEIGDKKKAAIFKSSSTHIICLGDGYESLEYLIDNADIEDAIDMVVGISERTYSSDVYSRQDGVESWCVCSACGHDYEFLVSAICYVDGENVYTGLICENCLIRFVDPVTRRAYTFNRNNKAYEDFKDKSKCCRCRKEVGLNKIRPFDGSFVCVECVQKLSTAKNV